MSDDEPWLNRYYDLVLEAASAAAGDAGPAALDDVAAFVARAVEMTMHEQRGVSVAPAWRRPLHVQLLAEARRRDKIGDVPKLLHGHVPEVIVWVAAAAMAALRDVNAREPI